VTGSVQRKRSGFVAGFWRRMAGPLSSGLQFAVVSFLSFSLALALSSFLKSDPDTALIGAMWAMISAIIVTQDTRSATIATAWIRIAGSLIGAVFAAAYLSFLPFSAIGMGVLIGITVIACQLLTVPGYVRLAALTAGIVMVISVLNPAVPPVVNAATRFFEVIIGSTVAVCIAWAWQYLVPVAEKGG